MSKAAPKILGIIPARGGSKGVPRKNIKLLAGQPLLAYMLQAALGSKLLTRVVVSSEDEEILAVAKKIGGEKVALKRPSELAEDTTPDVPVLQHAVRALENTSGIQFDFVVMLHATSPFMKSEDIDRALTLLLNDPTADSIVSVFQVNSYHPSKLKKIAGNRILPYIDSLQETTTSRRQDVEPIFKRNGGLYAAKRTVVMDSGTVWGTQVIPYRMPEEQSLEIDSSMDFLLADLWMSHFQQNKK